MFKPQLISSKTEVRIPMPPSTSEVTPNVSRGRAKWKKSDNDTVVFEISADRFLRGMVRAIVGTMLILNEGKINLSDFKKIIFKNDRRNAGYSVFPGGLYLKEVLYSNKL